MSSDQTSMLECRNLWKVFGDGAEESLSRELNASADASTVAANLKESGSIVACGDVDLAIKPGEFFVLMGLSGSGKSTLLRCMSRLADASAGELTLDGSDFLALNEKQLMQVRREKMGMVFQHFGLFPHMNVLENVAFPLRVQSVSVTDRHAKALEMIKIVGLEGREDALPHQLSGGQKQRVGIARSLAVDPELWFLDEPFSALDPLIRWQMQSELLSLQQRFKKTIVFVTHDFMEAVRLADRIAIMKDGFVVQVGTPQEIVLAPANDYVAEFVKEAPRTKIIKLDQLLEPASSDTPASGSSLRADMTLEDALAWGAERGEAMPVCDETGKTVGVITPERLAAALKAQPAKQQEN